MFIAKALIDSCIHHNEFALETILRGCILSLHQKFDHNFLTFPVNSSHMPFTTFTPNIKYSMVSAIKQMQMIVNNKKTHRGKTNFDGFRQAFY